MDDVTGEEAAAIEALHEQRRAAALALLNQYNPQWFPDPGKGACDNTHGVHGGGGSSSGSSAVDSKSAASAHACFEGDERLRAAAAFAKQKAAAMALLNEHNSDWFGDAGMGEKKAPSLTKRKSLLRMIGKARKSNTNTNNNNSGSSSSSSSNFNLRRGSYNVLAGTSSSERPTSTGTPTTTPSPRSLSMSMGIRSESPPSSTIRHSIRSLGRSSTAKGPKNLALSGAGAPGSSSSDKSEKQRGNSPWFSRHGSTRSVSSCPATPGDAGSRKGITARSPEVDYGISHGKDHDSTSCGERRWSPTPTIQAPLMDVLENKSQEPMSLRSMLRFARENLMEENVLFYLEVVSFKTGGGGQGEYLTHLKRIKELYIQTASPREVNISGDIRTSTLRTVESILSCTGNTDGEGSSAVASAACESSHLNGGVLTNEVDEGGGGSGKKGPSVPSRAQETGRDKRESCGAAEAQLPASSAAETNRAAAAVATTQHIGPEAVEILWRDGDDGNGEAPVGSPEAAIRRQSSHGMPSQPSTHPLGSTPTPPPSLPPRPPTPTPIPKTGVVADVTDTAASTEVAAGGTVITGQALPGQSARSAGEAEGASKGPTASGTGEDGVAVTKGVASVTLRESSSSSGRSTGGNEPGQDDSERQAEQEDDQEEDDGDWKCRERDCAVSWEDFAGCNADAADTEGRFDVSVEIEHLGLSIGPGGGYGDRTIFDSALLEIFVLLRHEVYPKFVARVMKRSRETTSATNMPTLISSARSTRSTTPDSTARSIGEQPAPWSQSDEGGKPRRFSFTRRK